MKKAHFLFYRFLLPLLLVIQISGCVGEIETTEKKTTVSENREPKVTLTFSGIHSAVPIAHDKIEVYFFPATGGSGDYSYLAYVGDNPDPITATEETMFKDYRGLFRLLITGLTAGTSFTIKVDAKDIKTDVEIISSNSVAVTTFSNYVTNFYGISAVSNASGVDGIDSINVRWVPTDNDPSAPFGSPSDPKTYEVIIIDASLQTPAAANNYNLNENQGRIARSIEWKAGLNSATVRGLQSDKEYYVFVRVLHKGSSNSITIPSLRSELNNKYLSIRTLSSNASSITYDETKFTVNPSSGQQALNTLRVTMPPITGVFDHLRIYYAKSNRLAAASSIDTSTCPAITSTTIENDETACKKFASGVTNISLSDLTQLVNYEVQLIVCLTADCSTKVANPGLRCNGLAPIERCKARTEPNIASFSGIQNVTSASDVSEVGLMFLHYIPPNFDNGYFDGLAIEFTTDRAALNNWIADPASNPKPITYILNDVLYNGSLDVLSYDLLADQKIIISNVDYSLAQEQCYSLYPFIYDTDNNMDSSSSEALKRVWKCARAQAEAPRASDFIGFESAETSYSNVSLTWPRPAAGVFTHYEIFYRKGSNATDRSFNFSQAIQDTTQDYDFSEYQRKFISATNGDGTDRLTSTISNLEDGRWIFGIRTYYLSGSSGDLRSEETAVLAFCNVNSTSTLSVVCEYSQ